MASPINDILKKFFGNKSERDIREILPLIEKIHAEFDLLQGLGNDALRAKTKELKEIVRAKKKPAEEEIASIRAGIESENIEISEAEERYKKIEAIEKEMINTIEKTLNEILPAAFAIVKKTAKRFKENDYLEATATDFNRDIAV